MDRKQKIKELLSRVSALKTSQKEDAVTVALMRLGTGLSNLPDRHKDITPLAQNLTKIKKELDNKSTTLNKEIIKRYDELSTAVKETGEETTAYTRKNVEALVRELKSLKRDIQYTSVDLSNLQDISDTERKEIRLDVKKAQSEINRLVSIIEDELKARESSESSITKNITSLSTSLKKLKETIEAKIGETNNNFIERFSSIESKLSRGGSMNRQIKVGGVDPLTRYTDINLVAGAGVSISYANDNQDKNVDITFTAVGLSPQSPAGTVNGVNQTFVFTVAPNLICVDQGRFMRQTSSDGTVNWTGTTTVVLTVAPTFDIFGL